MFLLGPVIVIVILLAWTLLTDGMGAALSSTSRSPVSSGARWRAAGGPGGGGDRESFRPLLCAVLWRAPWARDFPIGMRPVSW